MKKVFVDPSDPFEISYIMKEFPRLSETFISNEIYQLEKAGTRLRVFSVKKPGIQKHHETIDKLKSPIIYLPQVGSLSATPFLKWLWVHLPKFMRDHFRLLRLRPRVYLQTLREAVNMSFRYRSSFYDRPKKVFIKEFLQAGYIARHVIEAGNIRHLHAHFCHGSTTIAMFVSQLSGVPFSFTAHAKDIYLKKLNPGNLLQTKIEKAEFVVTCTEANRIYLKSLCPEAKSVYRVYHGLDTSFFTPDEDKTPSQPAQLILSVGRFVEKKGFVHLIKACAILRERGHLFQCRIIGEADEQTPLIKQLIAEFQLEKIVSLEDGVTHEALKRIYGECTVFVLPCQIVENGDRDGIPNVLVEAMSMKRAVVSTLISGIPELVEHRRNGLLVPQKDPAELAQALEELLNDPVLRTKLGDAARRRVCIHFDSTKTTLALKSLFDSSVESRRQRSS